MALATTAAGPPAPAEPPSVRLASKPRHPGSPTTPPTSPTGQPASPALAKPEKHGIFCHGDRSNDTTKDRVLRVSELGASTDHSLPMTPVKSSFPPCSTTRQGEMRHSEPNSGDFGDDSHRPGEGWSKSSSSGGSPSRRRSRKTTRGPQWQAGFIQRPLRGLSGNAPR